MSYTPYLVANYATGLSKRLQPWLIADDAQAELFDGDIYRGILFKRNGYIYFANGQRGGAPYCESRIVNHIGDEQARTSGGVLVTGNGSAGPYTFRIQDLPVRRGTVNIHVDALTAADNGLGGFIAPASGTIDYTTGDVVVTFSGAVTAGHQLLINYDYHPGLPVMGIMNFVTVDNLKDLIVADTKRLNIYNSTTNRLEYLGRTIPITGLTQATPGEVTAVGHGLSDGDRVFIYGVVGMNEVNNREFTITRTGADTFTIVDTSGYTAYTSGGTVELIYTGANFNFWSWVNYKDKNNNPRLLFSNNKNQIGYYAPSQTPTVGDYVAYPTFGAADFQMLTVPGGAPVTTITCAQLVGNKDRLLMLRTTENGVVYPFRIRVSGLGQSCDDFRTSATGAGVIDIPDASWIQGASFNRDDLIIFTERSTWLLQYTGNDAVPFVLKKIDESRGCEAQFSVITYLNRTSAASPRGLIISDGYRVERQDLDIPDFSFNEIDGEYFYLCFAGTVDADRDHYLLYPPQGQVGGQEKSERILVTNYDEDNYSIYRLPLSCMGTYVTKFDVTWDDLLKYDNWDQFAEDYGDWNSFAYNSGSPFSIGGGHKGEIWTLNVTEQEDNPVKIRNITVVDSTTLEVTTDWNNYSKNTTDPDKGADAIFFTGVNGMLEVNHQQYNITDIIDFHTFRVKVPATLNPSAYTSGGQAIRVIPFSSLLKEFNPYVDSDKKVRCGWLYMYVESSGTLLRRNIQMTGASNTNPCVVNTAVEHNLSTGEQVNIFGVGGMTELNNNSYFITVLSPTSFSLNGINATGYGVYTTGGYAAAAEKCKISIDIYTNDNESPNNTQLNNPDQDPYQGACTNLSFETGSKKWYKVYINQVGKFIQFRVRNRQAGARVFINAFMPGFQPVGRLI